MEMFVLSKSLSYEHHLKQVLVGGFAPRIVQSPRVLIDTIRGQDVVVLVHAASFSNDLQEILEALTSGNTLAVGLASDKPMLAEMLALTRFGISAYFNSYMADVHYDHLLTLLGSGQTWFSPGLLNRALELAREAMQQPKADVHLKPLTPRECEIARDVAQGFSNKRIASVRDISESTVKTHLTRIFKKLHIADRTSLAIKLSDTA